MRGIPFKVTPDEIKVFFYGFGQVHRSDIIIEEREYGKRTGVALVFFESEEITQLAKKKMNKNYLLYRKTWQESPQKSPGVP